jgi:hypothetical protein
MPIVENTKGGVLREWCALSDVRGHGAVEGAREELRLGEERLLERSL